MIILIQNTDNNRFKKEWQNLNMGFKFFEFESLKTLLGFLKHLYDKHFEEHYSNEIYILNLNDRKYKFKILRSYSSKTYKLEEIYNLKSRIDEIILAHEYEIRSSTSRDDYILDLKMQIIESSDCYYEIKKIIDTKSSNIYLFPYYFYFDQFEYAEPKYPDFLNLKKAYVPELKLWQIISLVNEIGEEEVLDVYKKNFSIFFKQFVKGIMNESLRRFYFTFGKFKGKPLMDVLKTEPSYLEYCFNNINDFFIDYCIPSELLGIVKDESKKYYNYEIIEEELLLYLGNLFGSEIAKIIYKRERFLNSWEETSSRYHDNDAYEQACYTSFYPFDVIETKFI